MYDGTSYDATIVGYDESNDIAVLKIDATGLTPVVLGDSDELNVGDSVVAIGNPLGELTFSPDVRRRERAEPRGLPSNVTMDLIQTGCAIPTPATPAVRCSTSMARSSASRMRSIPAAALPVRHPSITSALPSRSTRCAASWKHH